MERFFRDLSRDVVLPGRLGSVASWGRHLERSGRTQPQAEALRMARGRKSDSGKDSPRAAGAGTSAPSYLTNRWDLTVEQLVSLANGRCDQENVIEQLKNGVNAMRMPADPWA